MFCLVFFIVICYNESIINVHIEISHCLFRTKNVHNRKQNAFLNVMSSVINDTFSTKKNCFLPSYHKETLFPV